MGDLIIITAILALAIFSAGIRLLLRRDKTLLDSGESSTFESSTYADGVCGEAIDSPPIEHALDVTIDFSESGKCYRWIQSHDSLLDFAESRGVEVESLCRAGECGSCRTRLVQGEVEYTQVPAINPGSGYCLLCISRPKSDLILEK
ncbi:MAG: 2Fe-2S iron-sulfur cluster-binding protein [Candidatus Thiodiazotropha endolucinida]